VSRRPGVPQLLGVTVIAIAVTVAHLMIELATWAIWDAAPTPGRPYPHPMPAMWPVISFPVFPLYDWLSGGDRNMNHTFEWLMLCNSTVWGIVAGIATRILFRRFKVDSQTVPKPRSD